MAEYRLTSRAGADLAGISDYTIETFGIDQARRYRDELEACFESLAGNPRLGRDASWLVPGLRRFEHRSHTIFFAEEAAGVLIVRILHASMGCPAPLVNTTLYSRSFGPPRS